MMVAGRTLPLLLASMTVLGASGPALAYRPFDSTDAAVADLNEIEIEFGPAGFRHSGAGSTLIAPSVTINYGFARNWELVLEVRAEHSFSSAETHSRLIDDALSLKGVLVEGALQGKSGPSVATEFGVLLPESDGRSRAGASWAAIVSNRWGWGTLHLNAGAALTREQRGDAFVGAIVEGPNDWPIRPVAEVRYEREFGATETVSGLAGMIWTVNKTLAVDFGVREALVDRRSETEVRAGLTCTIGTH